MNVKKCANGHFFDADKYQLCPHCGASTEQSNNSSQHAIAEKKDRHPVRRKKEETIEPIVRAMPEKTMGKTFGVFDEPENQKPIEKSVRVTSGYNPSAKAHSKKETMSCVFCGRQISANARFCKYCGKALNRTSKESVRIQSSEPESPSSAENNVFPVFSLNDVYTPKAQDKEDVSIHSKETESPDIPDINVLTVEPEKNEEIQESITISPAKSSLEEAVKNAVSGNDGRTVGFFSLGTNNDSTSVDPVVGWLVCVKGKHFGESFPISAGRNSIGRGISNKIVIQDDTSVSREKHAWITYDPKHRVFFIQPGSSTGLTYLNDETVMETKHLAAKDRIEIGDGMYLLIPLCNEEFSWEDYIK